MCQGKDTKDQICVPKSLVCDGKWHCEDGKDEKQDNPKCKTNLVCNYGEFMCNDHKMCIADGKLCDGNPDCEDETDEDAHHCGRKITITVAVLKQIIITIIIIII